MRVLLRDLEASAATHRLTGLVAFVDVASPQRGYAVHVQFGVVNEGAATISVLNPFDLVQLRLNDREGRPLRLAAEAPSMLVHRPASEPWKLRTGLPIVEAVLNDEEIATSSLDVPVVELLPGRTSAVTHAITEHLAETTAVHLSDGDYAVGCIATLISAVDTGASRILESPMVPVQFARAPAP